MYFAKKDRKKINENKRSRSTLTSMQFGLWVTGPEIIMQKSDSKNITIPSSVA